MKKISLAVALSLAAFSLLSEPVKVIFDTDMYTDFDDAGALACLHAMADAGECEILATVANTRDCMSVAMCEIINAYYGRPDIPVGCSKEIGKSGSEPDHVKRYAATVKKYGKWVRHLNSNDAPDANDVYRKILASQPDKSVVICSVGFLTNMRRLVETDPDLVARKVKVWVAMACKYPNGKEYNSMIDPESSRIALEKWPTEIIFTDFEYGRDCFAGRVIAESGIKDSPIADVFAGNIPSREEIRKESAKHLRWCNGMGGRAAWDETAVIIAVRGIGKYFNAERGTYRMVGDKGDDEWSPDEENGRHIRVTEKVPKSEIGRIIDELICRGPRGKSAKSSRDWPLITVRYDRVMGGDSELIKGEMAINRKYPGACDDIWSCGGGIEPISEVAKMAREIATCREECERSGVRLSYQQGRTLGHGAAHDGKTNPNVTQFPDDAWQVDNAGVRHYGIACPRSPEILAYEREFAKTIVSNLHPWSYWLDDDLRMGVHKANGCFCDRCMAAFNAKVGGNWTRQTLSARLFSKEIREPLRAAWVDFNQESLAIYANAAREGVEAADPDCRVAYQAVWSDTIYTGRDNRKLLEALSGPRKRTIGIRPGAGVYTEESPRLFVNKTLSVAREAERCRDYGFVGSVCYEQETYPRRLLHKSPGAVVTECSLALASGCNALSLYWYIGEKPAPMAEYDRAAKAISEARPYFERLVESVERTRLAGISRFVGSAAAETAGFDIRDQADYALALAGVPVTVAEAGYPLWYLTEKSYREMTEADKQYVAGRSLKVPDGLFRSPVQPFLLINERTAFLDEIDRLTGGRFPVRLEECRPVRILPRALADGKLDCVTLLNCSMGETDEMTLRIRNPVGTSAEMMIPRVHMSSGDRLACIPSGREGEWIVKVPSMSAWSIATIFFSVATR